MNNIPDMLTIIRNGYSARRQEVSVPYSRTKQKLAEVLADAGFIGQPKISGQSVSEKKIIIALKYDKKEPALTGIKTISKPGVRIYSRVNKLPRVRFGHGLTIVSTSRGLMSDREARKQNLGGEVICQVW